MYNLGNLNTTPIPRGIFTPNIHGIWLVKTCTAVPAVKPLINGSVK